MALTLNASAFFVEIWRGSVEAIARTQWEAAASIGMSRWQQLRHIIAPQALRVALAPSVGMMIVVLKGTALTALIGFVEVTRQGQLISGVTFQPLITFLVVGAIYLALCLPLADSPNGSNGDFMSIVRLQSVRKRYGQLEVLNDISLEVEAGSVVVIIGRSGSGKSTLLRCVLTGWSRSRTARLRSTGAQ